MRLPAMFVRLSVSKITQKRVHGFGWNFACRQLSGHGRTDQLLSPIRVIVRMPEPENLKVEDVSKSVKQAPHSEQATGHGMHCKEILFTPRCSPRAREFRRLGRLFCTTYGCGATGRQIAQFSDFDRFPHTKPLKRQNAKTRFSQKLSNLYSHGLYWRPIGSCTWAFQRTHYGTPKIAH